jgi:hypothetical protein
MVKTPVLRAAEPGLFVYFFEHVLQILYICATFVDPESFVCYTKKQKNRQTNTLEIVGQFRLSGEKE